MSQVRQASAVTSRSNLIFSPVKRRFKKKNVPRSLQSWVSIIQSVVLTADVFQLVSRKKRWICRMTTSTHSPCLASVQHNWSGDIRLSSLSCRRIAVMGQWSYALVASFLEGSLWLVNWTMFNNWTMFFRLHKTQISTTVSLPSSAFYKKKWVSSTQSVVLTADVLQFFVKHT